MDKQYEWFSKLSDDEKRRFAPSYIGLLQQQLASAHVRFKRMDLALDTFAPFGSRKDHQRKIVPHPSKVNVCRNCYRLNDAQFIFQCGLCDIFGCSECNTSEKGIVRCSKCRLMLCESCIPGVKQVLGGDPKLLRWRCPGCVASRTITKSHRQKLEDLDVQKITRTGAITLWKLSKEHRNHRWLIELCLKAQFGEVCVFSGECDDLEEDFPSEEFSIDFVIVPSYWDCHNSNHLMRKLIDDFNLSTRAMDVMDEPWAMCRNSLTVRELLELFRDNGHITQQQIDEISSETLDIIFD